MRSHDDIGSAHEVARREADRSDVDPFLDAVVDVGLAAALEEQADHVAGEQRQADRDHEHLEAAGLAPDEVFFTDDRPENVAAARELGWRAEVFSDSQKLAMDLEQHGIRFNR